MYTDDIENVTMDWGTFRSDSEFDFKFKVDGNYGKYDPNGYY
jgi:hypothetical protein